MFSSLGELLLFCPSAETSLADNRTVDLHHWDFAFERVNVASFTISIIWIVKIKIKQCFKSREDEKLKCQMYKHARRFNDNVLHARTSTTWGGWCPCFCFLSLFRPSSHNLTAAKHECGSEKIYARCVHPSALCTSESKCEHESCSCHPPGLCSYLCALLPSEWHGAPCEFLMLFVTLISKRTWAICRMQ